MNFWTRVRYIALIPVSVTFLAGLLMLILGFTAGIQWDAIALGFVAAVVSAWAVYKLLPFRVVAIHLK